MKQAIVRTDHSNPERIATSMRPDNTAEMETMTTDDSVITAISRADVGGLQTSIDDYLVNLQVAEQIDQGEQTENMTTTDNTESRQ